MSCDREGEAEIQKFPDCKDRDLKISADVADQNLILEYDLKSYQHRGLVVVFNHEKFDFDLEPRAGTTKDADRLQAAFKSRGFLVLPTFNDKSHAEIKSILGKGSKVKREGYGSVLIFALSHGLDGGQIAARDKFYSASDLREPFLDNPAFKDKPLIFVHQACRGDYKEKFASRKSPSAYKNGDELHSGQNDILLAFATLEGHKSYRHKTEGSFYIQKMCDILEKNNDIEILDLLTAANCSVIDSCAAVKEKMETFDKVQTATFKSTLLKRFFLRKCRTNEAELNSISDKRQTPVECYVPQPECQYRGAAIIFHDENHKSEAIEFLESMKELNFSCQPVDHEPSDRELTNLSGNFQLEECSSLFIGIFLAASRHIFLHSRLLEHLNNKTCSYMNAKPKIFLFACKEETTLKKTKMDNVKSNRQVTCFSDVLAIYGYSTNFLHSFAAHLRTSKGSDVIASVRFAQRNTSQEIHRPCNVIMSSTLRFRIDCSKEMLVHDDNALKVSPVFSYHVRDPVANFQHRTKELEVMCNVLQSNASKIRRFSINMWLTGYGGLGKSQTVMKYIQNARTQNVYQNILWINGSSPSSIKRDIQNISETLEINLPIRGKINNELKHFYSKITDFGKTLLVLDNLDKLTKDEVIDVFPKDHNKDLLRIIVTSIHNVDIFKLTSKVEKCISIIPFTRKESNEFISKNLKNVECISDTLIDTFGEEFSFFPSVLTIAVALANEKMKSCTSPSDVIEDILKPKTVQNIQKGDINTKGYNKSLYYIVSRTMEHLEENKEELALKFLKILSNCEPDNIPHEIVFQSKEIGAETRAIRKLISLQIINANKNLYSIHRIIQSIVCNSLENKEQKCILQSLMQNIVALQNESKEYSKAKRYILHAAKVSNNIASFSDLYIANKRCIIIISSELQLIGWYEDATKFNENHLKFSSQIFGVDSKEYSSLLLHKVLILVILKDYEEALSWITVLETLEPYNGYDLLNKISYHYTGDQLFEIQTSDNIQKLFTIPNQIENIGVEFKELVRMSSDIGAPVFVPHVLATQDQSEDKIVPLKCTRQANDIKINVGIQKARILQYAGKINEALEVSTDLLQPDLAYELSTLLDLVNVQASLLTQKKNFEQALELYSWLLNIRNSENSAHQDLASKHNKANVLIEMKRYEEAKDILLALKLEMDKRLGENHPETFATRYQIANLFYVMGKSEESLTYTNETLHDMGDNNKIFTVRSHLLTNKALIYAKLNRYSEALEIMKGVQKLRQNIFGDNDFSTVEDLFEIARIHKQNNDFKNALLCLDNILLKQKHIRIENAIFTMQTEIEMSKIFLIQGKYDNALDLENIIIEKQYRIYGERHYIVARTMKRIANILYMTGRFADALRMCENAILIFNDNNFTLASDVLKIEYMKATILIAKEKFGEAHIILQDVKQRVQNCKYIKPAFVSNLNKSLSNVLREIGQSDEALALSEEALDQSIKNLGLNNLDTISAMNNKAYLLHCVGRNTQALGEIETVEKMREQILGETNPNTLHTKYFKGLILSDLAKQREALGVFNFVLEHRRKVLDEDHPEVYNTIHHRAKVLLNMGRCEDALAAFNDLLEADERKYGVESVQATCSMNSIATCYERMGQTFEAVQMYSAALQTLEGLLGPSHPNVEIVRANRDSAVQKFVANLQQ